MNNTPVNFIIPTFCSKQEHVTKVINTLKNIFKYHPSSKIFIINDHSTIDVQIIKNTFSKSNDIKIINSKYQKGVAEMLPYLYMLQMNDCSKAVIIVDSVDLLFSLTNELQHTTNIKYIMHFTNHRVHWNKIKEPSSEFNVKNNIHTHSQLIKYFANKNLTNKKFLTYFNEIYDNMNNWVGCFGCMSIITYAFLKKLEHKTNILRDTIPHIKNKRDRMVMETLFSIACQYVLGQTPQSLDNNNSLYYDGIMKQTNDKIYLRKTKHFGKISLQR